MPTGRPGMRRSCWAMGPGTGAGRGSRWSAISRTQGHRWSRSICRAAVRMRARGRPGCPCRGVRDALEALDGPAVLVGHSYGGIPITQVSVGRDDVAHLVYVCAFQLDVGESLLGALGGEVPDWIEITANGAASKANRPRETFCADVDPGLADASEARLSEQSVPSFSASSRPTGGTRSRAPSSSVSRTERSRRRRR